MTASQKEREREREGGREGGREEEGKNELKVSDIKSVSENVLASFQEVVCFSESVSSPSIKF